MDKTTKELLLQLHAHIQAITAVLIANGLTTEERINQLSQNALLELKSKLPPNK